MRTLLPEIAGVLGLIAIGGLGLLTAGLVSSSTRPRAPTDWWWAHSMSRQDRAISRAQWESYADPQGEGVVEVGVRLVARWGRHEKIIRYEAMNRVQVDDLSSTDLAEAQYEANRRAGTYNSLRKRN